MMEEMRIKEESITPLIDMSAPEPLYKSMRVATSSQPLTPLMKMFNNGKTNSETKDLLDGLLEYLEINSEMNSTPIHPPSPKDIPSSVPQSTLRPSTPYPQEPPSYYQAIQYYRSQTPPRFPFQDPPTMPKLDRVLPPTERHWEPGMPGDEARRDQWRRAHRHEAYRENRRRERMELNDRKKFAKRFEVK